jgi:hypothetical protein
MAGVISAWLQEEMVAFVCARSWIVLPFLFVMVLIAWIFCALFLALGICASDFCHDSPDSNVSDLRINCQVYILFMGEITNTYLVTMSNIFYNELQVELVLRNFRQQLGSVVYTLLIYYIEGCTSTFPQIVETILRGVVIALTTLTLFSEKLAMASADKLQAFCGQDQQAVSSLSSLLAVTLRQYTTLIVNIRQLFDCAIWSPIYTNIVYDGKTAFR